MYWVEEMKAVRVITRGTLWYLDDVAVSQTCFLAEAELVRFSFRAWGALHLQLGALSCEDSPKVLAGIDPTCICQKNNAHRYRNGVPTYA